MSTRLLIDLHCDVLDACLEHGLTLCSPQLHFSLAKLPECLHICQAAAIFIDSKLTGQAAQERFMQGYELYRREVDTLRLPTLRDLSQIPQCLRAHDVTLFLTVEGGSVLAGDIAWVDKLSEMGVTMLTLTWNGSNEICGGVGSEQGFTPFGKQVVRRMEALGMAVDVSHMNETSFWQLCDFAQRPFCASHSNAHAVCDHPRNLTDAQFEEIVRRGGVVGLNYYREFITRGGNTRCIDNLLRHVHHFLALGGQDTLALGSDFDGSTPPDYLDGIDKLPGLIDALERSGIGSAVVEKILYRNAAGYLGGFASEISQHKGQ